MCTKKKLYFMLQAQHTPFWVLIGRMFLIKRA